MTWTTAALVLAVALLALIFWSAKRHKDPHLQLESREPIERLIPSIAGISLATTTHGNAVEIFQNGAF
jgi:cardiolipin synthase